MAAIEITSSVSFADAVTEIAAALVVDFDSIEVSVRVVERIAEALGAVEVGIMLADSQHQLRLIGSTSERLRLLELFELQAAEGPCPECYKTGEAILCEDVAKADARWPNFAPKARSMGFRCVYALPLRSRDLVVGALNIFLDDDHPLSPAQLGIAQALGNLATVAVTQEQSAETVQQLQRALDARVIIEQAKGLLAERLDICVQEAFEEMRSFSRNNNKRLSDVAADLVSGTTLNLNRVMFHKPGPTQVNL